MRDKTEILEDDRERERGLRARGAAGGLRVAMAIGFALCAEPAKANDVATLVVVNGKGAAPVASLIETVVARTPGYKLVPLIQGLKGPGAMPADEAKRLARAKDAFSEGVTALQKGNLRLAERLLGLSVQTFESVAAHADPQGEYGSALAHQGVCQSLRKNNKAAVATFRVLATMDPNAKLSGDLGDPIVGNLKKAKAEVAAAQRGTILLDSTPTGASVVLDGAYRGTTPLRLGGLAYGRHLLKLEHPGSYSFGQVFTVSSANPPPVKVKLKETKEYLELVELKKAAAREASKQRVGEAGAKLAKRLDLDRMLVAELWLRDEVRGLDAAVLDFRTMQRTVQRQFTFEGRDREALEDALGQFVGELLKLSTPPRTRITIQP
jgi:hypothetical protein